MFLWRIVANRVTKPLTALVNQTLSSGIFPDIFKQADIIPIFKKGKSDNAKHFRPIAILHNLSKTIWVPQEFFHQRCIFFSYRRKQSP